MSDSADDVFDGRVEVGGLNGTAKTEKSDEGGEDRSSRGEHLELPVER